MGGACTKQNVMPGEAKLEETGMKPIKTQLDGPVTTAASQTPSADANWDEQVMRGDMDGMFQKRGIRGLRLVHVSSTLLSVLSH